MITVKIKKIKKEKKSKSDVFMRKKRAPVGKKMDKLTGIAIIFVLVLLTIFVFSSKEVMSTIYFMFGTCSMFSAAIYVQLHLFHPERKAPKLKSNEYPSITVLVPNHNYAHTLRRSLNAIVNLKYPKPFDIIVIDDCSTDDSVKIIKEYAARYPQIKFIRNEKNKGKAASLNSALNMTRSKIVACIDSDTYPPEDTLLKMVPYFYKRRNIGAVTAFITAADPKNFVQKVQELEYYSAFGFVPKMMTKIDGLTVTPGPLTLFDREKLVEVGGFDEHNLTEDMEIGLKLHWNHYAIEYCPEVTVPTEVPNTLKKLYRQRIRWYRGTIFNLRKYKDMLFNKKYHHIGMFSLPTCFIYVVFVILTFLILFWNFSRDLLLKLETLAIGLSIASLSYINYIGSLLSPISFNSAFFIFFILFLSFWVYYLISSIKIAKVKLNLSHIPAVVFIILVYPLFVSICYIISFAKEMLGGEMIW